VVATRVLFAALSEQEIEDYVPSGEPLACAGGFALEGRGGMVAERLDGCYGNVIGLSLPWLRRVLQGFRPSGVIRGRQETLAGAQAALKALAVTGAAAAAMNIQPGTGIAENEGQLWNAATETLQIMLRESLESLSGGPSGCYRSPDRGVASGWFF